MENVCSLFFFFTNAKRRRSAEEEEEGPTISTEKFHFELKREYEEKKEKKNAQTSFECERARPKIENWWEQARATDAREVVRNGG
jgi:hypothetical protein